MKTAKLLVTIVLLNLCFWVQDGPAQNKSLTPKTLTDELTSIDFVWVEGGCFEMGCGNWAKDCSSDEKPAHEVCVEGFWIGRYEVTQVQWEKIMLNNPAEFPNGENYPVENVSYVMAADFIDRLNKKNVNHYYNLPTEAEWEFAARSRGKSELYAGGNDPEKLGFHKGNSNGSTHPVGSKKPNGLGIYDMSGNVWEWCQDWWADNYKGHAKDNPSGPAEGRLKVVRGGAWSHNKSTLRTTARYADLPDKEKPYNGFRVLMRNK